MKCIIVGAGDFYPGAFSKSDGDYIIAADGGYDYLININCTPDTVIGDFDSRDGIPNHPHVIKLNKIKDDTDMIAAVNLGIERGYREFHIHGATGGRLDHTLANIQTIAYLSKQHCSAYIYGDNYVITALTDGTITFDNTYSGIMSIFAHDTTVSGVTLTGLKYPLNDVELTNTFPLGVSNEFIGMETTVTVRNGTLIIIYKRV
jgi:thiamine pyrophosphokinase